MGVRVSWARAFYEERRFFGGDDVGHVELLAAGERK